MPCLSALKTIDQHLHSDPRIFGDLHFSMKEMKLDVYTRVVPPLVVHYGVHRTKDIVFVRKIMALPGAGI
jgi:hypothetical protein